MHTQVTSMSPVRWLPRSVHPVGAAAPLLSVTWCGRSSFRGAADTSETKPLLLQRQTEGPHSNAKSQGLRPSQPNRNKVVIFPSIANNYNYSND